MNPDDEDLLVIGAVENADPAALGQAFGSAPQEIVAKLLRGRTL